MSSKSQVLDQALQLPGYTSREDLDWLYRAASPYATGVEVGTYAGRSAVVLANTLYHLTCIDPWRDYTNLLGDRIAAAQAESIFDRARRQLPITKLKLTSAEAEPLIGQVDFIWLDGAHDWQSVREDCDRWLPHLKPGGVICGHDYALRYPDVMQAVDRRFPQRQLAGQIWHWQHQPPSITPAFLVHVYQDQDQAERLIGELRNHYPAVDILCIGDGSTMDSDFCTAHQIQFFQGDRLKLMDTGALWVSRMLSIFLQHSQADCLIKLDPDSRMHRRFKQIPSADWFGEVSTQNFFRPLVRGGCMGISRSLAERILATNLLQNPIYTRLPFGYLWQPDTWLSFTDGILADVCYRLGVSPELWTEICIRFRQPLPDLTPYAVSHPHD